MVGLTNSLTNKNNNLKNKLQNATKKLNTEKAKAIEYENQTVYLQDKLIDIQQPTQTFLFLDCIFCRFNKFKLLRIAKICCSFIIIKQ